MYPSEKRECKYGYCMVATIDVPTGTPIQHFEGPLYRWADVPETEVCHAILVDAKNWMVTATDARYLNHCCDPNCSIQDDMVVVTTRFVAAGDQLTFAYNVVSDTGTPDGDNFWDPRWSFRCECGAGRCQGRVL